MSATTNLEVVITAKDEASKVIGGLSGTLQNHRKELLAVGAAAGVAFAGIAAFAKDSIEKYSEAEKASKQLEHAVIDVSHATKEQLQATNDLADALERKGVLDGDNIKMGLAQLSTFGLSNKAVQGLGGALSDLAVNQFGVHASGEDLSNTANMIAKALNGQFGVLEKSGIRFSDAQQHMIMFGTEMQKVDAINQGFAQNLKYTNEVALQTTEGKLAAMNVQLENVQENIGQALVPILLQLAQAILPVIQSVVQWTQENPQLTRVIVLAGLAFSALLFTLSVIALILPFVISGFTLMLGPVGIIIATIGLLVLTMVNLNKIFSQTKEDWKLTWDGMKIIAQEAVDFITALWKPYFDALDRVQDKLRAIGDSLRNLGGKAGNVVSSAIGALSGARASGGSVFSGSSYLVGERGPEVFTPGFSGSISPNGGGNGGGVTVNVNGGYYLDQRAAKDFGDILAKNLGQQLKLRTI